MAEEGQFKIDHYLVYQRDEATDDVVRAPVRRAEYQLAGQRYHLCWVDMEWNLSPVGDEALAPGVKGSAMVEVCASGDIGYVKERGEFHPNKPPGTSFLALPGYFLIYHLEKLLGANPDHWFTMNVNEWLTSVFSVGLLSALGCVCFYRLAYDFSGQALPAVLATFAFAFGTTFLPFATLLFDHNLTASLLLASFYFLRRAMGKGSLGLAATASVASEVCRVGTAMTMTIDCCPERSVSRWNVSRLSVLAPPV